MKVYVGQARGAKLIATLNDLGFGEMTVREEYPPRRKPWAFDNGAFKDWKAGKPFDAARYTKALERIEAAGDRPAFAVVPDIVAGGLASLRFSEQWAPRLRTFAPLYLAVQDGMEEDDVRDAISPYADIFVGGSLPWKIRTAARWVALAHSLGLACHVGRVGTYRRTRWAQRIGCDSIDSCLPLWSTENLDAFRAGLAVEPRHAELFRESGRRE